MNILMRLLLGLAVVVAAILGIAYLRAPTEQKVERSITINASPEKIYPFIANLKVGWPQWNRLEAFFTRSATLPDASSAITYTGPEEGAGATRLRYLQSSKQSFTITITQADPGRGIEYTDNEAGIIFGQGKILFTPVENGTRVHWIYVERCRKNIRIGLMSLYMDMRSGFENMLGRQLDRNLQNLKNLSESA